MWCCDNEYINYNVPSSGDGTYKIEIYGTGGSFDENIYELQLRSGKEALSKYVGSLGVRVIVSYMGVQYNWQKLLKVYNVKYEGSQITRYDFTTFGYS